ncbi:MAG: ribonuclease Z [Candidatus Oleimicrobiaceae bacterium]
MRLIFLGTGASVPMPNRALPAVALLHQGAITLFDCGEGTQFQLLRAGLSAHKIACMCISHLHGDHLFGLPGLLASQTLMCRTSPLHLVGPSGLGDYLHLCQGLTGTSPSFELRITEIGPGQDHMRVRLRKATLEVRPLDHTSFCLGFRFVEDDHPGKFDVDAATRLDIPAGPQRAALVRGEAVILPDGRLVRPEAAVGPPRPGRKIAYCVDTRPCASALHLAEEADVLIHDATFAADEEERALATGHSTARQAAEIAAQARVRRLFLTHISARYANDVSSLVKESQALFPATEVAHDFMSADVARRE